MQLKEQPHLIQWQSILKEWICIDENGKIVQVEEDRRIHRILWLRTLEVAFFVTIFCFLMGYPIAHLLATLPMKYSNLLMICVLFLFGLHYL